MYVCTLGFRFKMSLSLIIVFFSVLVCSMSSAQLFGKKTKLDNKTCFIGDTIFLQPAVSTSSCLTLCSIESQCVAACYNKLLELCHGCRKRYENETIPHAKGFKMYELKGKFWI